MGCCGGRAKRTATPAARRAPQPAAAQSIPTGDSGLVLLAYYGARKGDFRVVSAVTRTRYHIPGRGEIVRIDGTMQQGVKPADVPWFRSANSGADFRPLPTPETPKPAPAPVPVVQAEPTPPPEPAIADSLAWTPAIMEEEPAPPVPDIQGLTVADIREMDVTPEMAAALYGQEQAGKQRKTVLGWLEGQM